MPRRQSISPTNLLTASGLLLLSVIMLRPQIDPDAWWHLRVAGQMIASHSLPTSDMISWWSAGAPWISPSWLNEILLWVAQQLSGPTGQSLLYLPVFAAIVLVADRAVAIIEPHVAAWQRLLVLIVVVAALWPLITPRAANWDLLFALFAVLGWLRLRADGSTRMLWLMPLGGVAWANLHGGGVMVYPLIAFAFGLGTWLDRAAWPNWRWRPFLASIGLTYLAFGLNGYGLALYLYPWTTVFSAAQAGAIAEWLSPDLSALGFLPLRVLLSLGLVLGLARARQVDAAGALAAGGMLFLGLASARYLLLAIPLLAIWYLLPIGRGVGTYLTAGLGRLYRWPARWSSPLLRGSMLVVALAIVAPASLITVLPAGQQQALAARYPGPTLAALAGCEGRLWSDYGWGGWVSYQTGRLVGPYGAADALGDERLTTASEVERLTTDPAPVFDSLMVEMVLTQIDRPLAHWLTASSDWRLVAQDEISLLYARQTNPCGLAGGG